MPEHLYEDLPEHFLQVDEKGRKVPDYLRMILMCEYCLILFEQARSGGRRSRAVLPFENRFQLASTQQWD